ncbi:unnamed protein product [Rhodiola kirilowii]
MSDDSFSPDAIFPATSMDSDFINELLLDGCWVETTEGDEFSSLLAPLSPHMASVPLPNSLDNLPEFEALNSCADSIPNTDAREEITETSKTSRKRPLSYSQVEDLAGTRLEELASSGKPESYLVDISEPNKRIWIGPKAHLGNFPSVRERLISAVTYLSESTGDSNMLIQIWVPIKSDNKHVLTTKDQPYFHDPNSLSLAQYRNVSKSYHLSVEENSRKYAGLPGRVFLHEVPEWTPDVRYFRQEEYPRIAYAQQLQVQASLALPVFEQGSGSCLGVVEIVTTNQKINYRPELETICKALEAFQLRSSEVTGLRSSKILNHSCAAVAPQINEFLTYTCKAHSLPLAQTWALCTQHGKGIGYNSTPCMSTVDDAYYVGDQKLLGFHEECCEQHLHGDKWIVGESFATNKLCSAPDITTYSKTDYPLSHHAIVFGLCAAVAVRVRSIFTGSADFVLEFFLPVSCKSFDEQQKMIGSLLNTLHACQSLYIVTDKDLYEESSDLPETVPEDEPLEQRAQYKEDSSWIANISGAQNKGKGIAVSLDTTKEKPNEEFEITTSWDETEDESRHEPILEDLGLFQEESKEAESGGGISTSFGGSHPSGNKKSGDEKRTKAEKTVSLHILQQYFAGSLKDAAKSLGVCPTTLKRICRQHGINRWPSRKIKKVGHSLKKLQLVMDTVKGANGSIQISSFYSKFPELGSPNVSGASSFVPKLSKRQIQHIRQQEEASLNPLSFTRPNDCSVQINPQLETGLISSKDTASKCPSSTKLLGRSKSHKSHPEQHAPEMLPPLPKNTGQVLRDNGAFRLKVTFGELKVRFSLHHNWVFTDLQQEITKRFNIDDINKLHLKYLDDDSEWVLLTCDGDLEECLDIHKATQCQTITLCLLHAPHSNLGTSFGSSGLS